MKFHLFLKEIKKEHLGNKGYIKIDPTMETFKAELVWYNHFEIFRTTTSGYSFGIAVDTPQLIKRNVFLS